MQEEIDSINENNTWILTSLPSDRKALRGKWVYKITRLARFFVTRLDGWSEALSNVKALTTMRLLLQQ